MSKKKIQIHPTDIVLEEITKVYNGLEIVRNSIVDILKI